MSVTTERSSIHLIFFFMQSKEQSKLTQALCRLAKEEYKANVQELPDDVRDDIRFDKIVDLIEFIEKSDYAKAMEILADAYRVYQDMLNYIPRQPSRNENSKTPTIFGDSWDGKMKSEPLRKFTPTPRDSVPTVQYTVVRDGQHDTSNDSSSIAAPTEQNFYSFKPNYLSKISPTEEKEFVFGSVSNSPTVLTERFGDLYDKERAAAFSELSQILGEKATIRHLLWIIAKASNVCASMATEQLADLENSSVGILVSRDPFNKHTLLREGLSSKDERLVMRARYRLISYRREIAPLSVPLLQKEIRRAIATELNTSLPRKFTGIGNAFMKYAEKCIELVWLMYVHDPPMYLEWLTKAQEGQAFQTDLYKHYTRSGLLFDYCVWPVIRLRRDGPLLAKGIAQSK